MTINNRTPKTIHNTFHQACNKISHKASNQTSKMLKVLLLLSLCFSITACGRNKDKDNYTGMSAEEIYSRSQVNVSKENFSEAVKDFEALEARFPYSDYSDKAQLGLIHAYHKRGDAALALSTADRFIQMHPRHSEADRALYLKGLVNFDEHHTFKYRYLPLDRSARDPSNAQAAFDSFKTLVEKFPNSQYTGEARQRMVHLRDQLASHEYHVVQYYIKRGAYLAAANRANYIVTHFNGSKMVPQALESLVLCYQHLKMPELENNARVLLETNFKNKNT